jgi:serine protease Do
VTQVFEGDPADRGGIKPNDIITAVNGKSVKSARELSRVIANIGVDKRTSITLLRNGKEKTVTIETAKRQDDRLMARQQTEEPTGELGLALRNLDSETARRFGYEGDEKGVLVTGVKPDSKAASVGFREGDLIKEVNRNPVESVRDLQTQLDKVKKGNDVRILLKRGQTGFLAMTFTK